VQAAVDLAANDVLDDQYGALIRYRRAVAARDAVR
jgi:hypothetical protein